jgi:hypothetical protein
MSIYQPIVFSISVIVCIAVALISVGWWFRDGDESTLALREFTEDNDRDMSG